MFDQTGRLNQTFADFVFRVLRWWKTSGRCPATFAWSPVAWSATQLGFKKKTPVSTFIIGVSCAYHQPTLRISENILRNLSMLWYFSQTNDYEHAWTCYYSDRLNTSHWWTISSAKLFVVHILLIKCSGSVESDSLDKLNTHTQNYCLGFTWCFIKVQRSYASKWAWHLPGLSKYSQKLAQQQRASKKQSIALARTSAALVQQDATAASTSLHGLVKSVCDSCVGSEVIPMSIVRSIGWWWYYLRL